MTQNIEVHVATVQHMDGHNTYATLVSEVALYEQVAGYVQDWYETEISDHEVSYLIRSALDRGLWQEAVELYFDIVDHEQLLLGTVACPSGEPAVTEKSTLPWAIISGKKVLARLEDCYQSDQNKDTGWLRCKVEQPVIPEGLLDRLLWGEEVRLYRKSAQQLANILSTDLSTLELEDKKYEQSRRY